MGDPYNGQYFTNTYSLWENSMFYDINNLSPQNRNLNVNTVVPVEVFRATKWPEDEECSSPEPPYVDNIRVVERDSLLEDPDTFYTKSQPTPVMPPKEPDTVWTERYWHRACGNVPEQQGSSKKKQIMAKTQMKQPTVQPNMGKAVTMMQKMGWHGGPLGLSGDGIVEPVTPVEQYEGRKLGLGHTCCTYKLKTTKSKKICSTEYFDTNVLLNIFEFVKNNNEVELLFDRRLYRNQRKRVHDLVEVLRQDDLAQVEFKTHAEMELVLQISDVNCYVLTSQSDGEPPHRQLCIYKEAPPYVYLIIPEDLRDDDICPVSTEDDSDLEEETNPFLISIKKNLKKQKKSDFYKKPDMHKKSDKKEIKGRTVADRIVEYFKEFTEKIEYTQFKFLGNFNYGEKRAINDFFNKAIRYLNNGGNDTNGLFSNIEFSVEEDVAGNTMIQKRSE